LIEFEYFKLTNIFFKFNFKFLYDKINTIKVKVYLIREIQLFYPNKKLKCKIFQLSIQIDYLENEDNWIVRN